MVEKECGLTSNEVKERILNKQTNKTKKVIGKTIPNILFTNLFSFFNIVLLALAVVIIIAKKYTSLAFFVIYVINIGIGLYQDFKAYRLLNKLKLIINPKTIAIRDGNEIEISVDDIVLDDLLIVKTSNQIASDGIITSGEVGVNESLLTGESNIIYKKAGDTLYSGTFIVSGTAKMKVIHVGKDNYISQLQKNASKNKVVKSEIKKTLDWLFNILSVIVVAFAVALIITNWNDLINNFESRIGTIAGSLVAMIPAGLYLLSSIALSVGVLNLSKRNALVQDYYSIEMLARTTVLCLDKTGTITDGTIKVSELINVSSISDKEIKNILINLVKATKDENATAKAIINEFSDLYEKFDVVSSLPFCSENKYSAIEVKENSYIFGALEFLNVKNKESFNKIINPFLNQGKRVLAIGKSKSSIKDNKISGNVEILGFVIMEDHIKDDAIETFKWFSENGVKIKVISGDNALSVSCIANDAEIENANNYISLEGMSIEEVKAIANQYTVFGRVTPEQKEALVDALKESGEKVAMTGDGVNDILALRKADCSIAMASGSDAARNVSQLVLLDSNFSSLPSVVAEGRRVVNNLQRTSSLFLCKTFFAIVMTLFFLILQWANVSYGYPFDTNNLYLWELTAIGLGSFFVALEPNKEAIKGTFFKNIIKICIPGGTMIIIGILTIFLLYKGRVAIFSKADVVNLCSILFAILPLATLYVVCTPFSKFRKIVFFSMCGLNLIMLVIQGILCYCCHTNEPLKIDFTIITPIQYCLVAVVAIICITIYIGVVQIMRTIQNKKNNNSSIIKEEIVIDKNEIQDGESSEEKEEISVKENNHEN